MAYLLFFEPGCTILGFACCFKGVPEKPEADKKKAPGEFPGGFAHDHFFRR
jgi:hypothetical protein